MLALQAGEPRHHDVEQKRGHGQENRRCQQADGFEALDVAFEQQVRELILARKCAEPAVPIEQSIDAKDHFLDRRVALQAESDVVERAVHVVGVGERFVFHPEDAEMLRIGQHVARLDLKHVFRRERDADDLQRLALAVDNRHDRIADVHAVFFDECFAGEHFVVAAERKLPTAADVDLVEGRLARHRQRDQLSDRGLVQPRHIERHTFDDPRLQLGNAGHFVESVDDRVRRPLHAGKHFRETISLVERGPRDFQRMQDGTRIDERGHAGRDHQRDRKHLSLHQRHVAEQLAIEGADHAEEVRGRRFSELNRKRQGSLTKNRVSNCVTK